MPKLLIYQDFTFIQQALKKSFVATNSLKKSTLTVGKPTY